MHDLTSDTERPPDEVCRELLDAIPPGWQHPDGCWAKITVESQIYEPPLVTETPWVMRAPVVVLGKPAGAIEVFYDQPYPPADDGPFLKEERQLLDTIADALGQYLSMRRMRGMLRHWHVSLEQLPDEDRREWRIIIEFLRRTDPPLLSRVSRRMINYLVWNGIDEAQHLLERLGANQRGRGGLGREPPARARQPRRDDAGHERRVPHRRRQPDRGRDRPRHRTVGQGRQRAASWWRWSRTSARRSPTWPRPSSASSTAA